MPGEGGRQMGSEVASDREGGPDGRTLLEVVVDALVGPEAQPQARLGAALKALARATGHAGAALVLPDDGQATPPTPEMSWGLQQGPVTALHSRRRGQLRGVVELRGGEDPQAGGIRPDAPPPEAVFLAGMLVVEAANADRLERRLDDERRRLALLADAAYEGLLVHDGARVLDANQALASLLGMERDDLPGRSIWDIAAPEEAGHILDRIRAGFQGRYRTLVVHRSGARIPVELQARQLERDDGPVRMVAIRDVREALQAEKALAEAEERTRALLELTFDGVAVTRIADGRVVEANDGFGRLFGRSRQECIGLTPADLCPVESAREIAAHVAAGHAHPYQVEGIRRDGQRFPMQVLGRQATWNGQAVRITGFRDVTAERQRDLEHQALLAQLHHAQKLKSLGVMAGGMAHDFNNLLGVIQGHGELAALTWREGRDPTDHLARVLEATARAAELTAKLLACTGRDAYDLAPLDLTRLVEESVTLLRAEVLQRGATLVMEPTSGPASVAGESTSLRQVVLTLISNAAEAVEARGDARGAEVRVRLRWPVTPPAEVAPPDYPADPLPLSACVLLEVEDTGVGILPEDRPRIFDPFFSTKFAGRGLGLAAAQGIVRGHGGAIRLHSTPGRGSTFQVYLPSTASAVLTPPARPAPPPADLPRPLVLVADDEPGLREVVRLMLGRMGLDCRLASDGDEAVCLFDAETQPLALAILDITMPGRTGIEVLAHLRGRAPTLPVLLISGYDDPAGLTGLPADPARSFLHKPFTLDRLRHAIRGLLPTVAAPT